MWIEVFATQIACLTPQKPIRIFKPHFTNAPVAQLDRVPDYESGGRTFESCRVHHTLVKTFISDLKQDCVPTVGQGLCLNVDPKKEILRDPSHSPQPLGWGQVTLMHWGTISMVFEMTE